ncbi:GAF domain-containing sensor histidine kinase [Mucilaginibacter sp. RB4R14]|uniref:GAF domain-containing sensor histidine kinase n=1 Tax=Mucilaginibacter aurantiaciroseus TaxID=2949308 RepID=UPI002090B2C3|nr:GAF domain-containing sensor histidine kinase [Mucilaginibacter aurantiaciroseus]MCO5934627.1 GAF domain-containing sensor histidine kinase [Mucilaginibacter aurantiaciroseus]
MKEIQQDIDAVGRIDAISLILEVVCRTTGMGFSAVARVTDDKWITCAVRDEIAFGLVPGSELKLETTICNEIRQHHNPVVIDHVALDVDFAQHHTPAIYGFQSYISFPITLKNGSFFGTLCAIDPNPAHLKNTQVMGMFKLFADLIAFHLDTQEKVASTEMELLEARKTAQLRDQFIAILGHDLGNPVGAILNVSQLLLRMPLDERTKRLANILQNSSYRMKALIENILDFARGRLGEGIILKRNDNEPIAEMLEQVIAELAILWPDRTINTNFRVKCAISCDGRRVSQVLSNLLGNAIAHGSKDTPVNVDVVCDADDFSISVTNSGSQIPDAIREKLFEPFSRGDDQGKDGLGLGLYIAAEIARAHSGTLTVKSDEHSTAFTFKMPVN